VEQKVQSHLTVIRKTCRTLPVSRITVETAAFDTQFLKAAGQGRPLPEGKDYQQGEQLGFWNVREYVLFRDGHACRCCRGKSKDPVLQVHHIRSRKTGGDSPDNLVTLCRTCHEGYHKGTVKLPDSIRRGNRYSDAAFMGIMRWAVYNRLKEEYPGRVRMTYGYITKNTRIRHGLPKEHCVDARCISGHPDAAPCREVFFQKKVRCHNRQAHKANTCKGGIRKRSQAPYLVKGFRLFDKVEYDGQECFIFGRRSSGYFDIRRLDGTRVHAGISYKKLRFLETRHTILTERRTAG
jgi:N6-L-threonylcarbamoyladenine synthase